MKRRHCSCSQLSVCSGAAWNKQLWSCDLTNFEIWHILDWTDDASMWLACPSLWEKLYGETCISLRVEGAQSISSFILKNNNKPNKTKPAPETKTLFKFVFFFPHTNFASLSFRILWQKKNHCQPLLSMKMHLFCLVWIYQFHVPIKQTIVGKTFCLFFQSNICY